MTEISLFTKEQAFSSPLKNEKKTQDNERVTMFLISLCDIVREMQFSLCRSHFGYFFLDVVGSGWSCSCGYFTGLRRVDDDDGLHFDATHCRMAGSFSYGSRAFEAFFTRYLTFGSLEKNSHILIQS